MSKQTINIGASPNDGTGTPLRTSFDYCNQNFTELYTATGPSGNNIVVPGNATITGALTVDTSTLKVDSTNHRVGIVQASPLYPLHLVGEFGLEEASAGNGSKLRMIGQSTKYNFRLGKQIAVDNAFEITPSTAAGGTTFSNPVYTVTYDGTHTFLDGLGGTRMTLNSTGLGVGGGPNYGFELVKTSPTIAATSNSTTGYSSLRLRNTATSGRDYEISLGGSGTGAVAAGNLYIYDNTAAAVRLLLDSSGNVGVGVTPSAWSATFRSLDIGSGTLTSQPSQQAIGLYANAFENGTNYTRKALGTAAGYSIYNGAHYWLNAVSGAAASTFSFGDAKMTLDSAGNLLVGLTSGSFNRIKKDSVADAGNAIFELVGASNATSSIHYSVSSYNANAANAASKFGRDGTTLRSINAGGTVNASGADYAEYMVKCGDFVLSKGDVSGIDANGKLTNMFADAVSFVVKSTDPSYVGNDKWGIDLEGADLEAARQLVDRIAFAGQVPVNVTGATAGDYIVPVVDGTGIKGISVSKPTFEQYQLAVGKVIAIDADGRARIIVKVV
jgi:hypothetical protein